jgi:flagellar motor switch/type III secretory pathway protein FliN
MNPVWRRPVAALLGAAAIALVFLPASVAKYSGYDALTVHAMGLVDESLQRDKKTFLVITGIKTALAVVEGSEVGVGFELKMGNRAGTMSLCIPYNVIEPIMGTLANQSWFSYQKKGGHDDGQRKLTRNVSMAPVEMRAFLATTNIKVSDLLSLQVGDVITTEKPLTADVFVQVEGRNKFHGQIGQFRGSRSIRITRVTKEVAEVAPGPHAQPEQPRGQT